MKDITIVGNARCYHAMDWFRSISGLIADTRRIEFLTDLIDSESHKVLVRPDDPIVDLYNIDWLLLRRQSRFGDIWRNMIKLAAAPVQVLKLKTYARQHPDNVYHAHTMYYMFLSWLAGLHYVGTPQGSEVLVRPHRSRFYRYMSIRALRAARLVTVDSSVMRDQIRTLAGVDAIIIQNGVEIEKLVACRSTGARDAVVSLRGFTDLYRIAEIAAARNRSRHKTELTFIYPFWADNYKQSLQAELTPTDRDLGRLDKDAMFALLGRTLLAISIPRSDSSPRSVYEAIFAGACVAATRAPWYEILPPCMKARIFIVDLEQDGWLDSALDFATQRRGQAYVPSPEAIEMFSQSRSMARAIGAIYT